MAGALKRISMKTSSSKESIITITEKFDKGYITRTVSINGRTYYSQTKDLQLLKNELNDSFVDRFFKCINHVSQSNRLDYIDDITNNSGDFFYFISQRRLQFLNFKQKFFYFLLKNIFFHGESATIEQIKRTLINFQVKRRGAKL